MYTPPGSPQSPQLQAFHTQKYRLTLAEWHNGYGKCIEVGVRSLKNSDDFQMIYLPSWSPEKWFELIKALMLKHEDADRTQKICDYLYERRIKWFHTWYNNLQRNAQPGGNNE